MYREVVIGSTRFWCPETVNDVIGVCDDLVIVTGHTRTFVWAMPGGELLAIWDRRGLHDTVAIARDGDQVIIDSRAARRRVELATGRVVYEGPPVPVVPVAGCGARRVLASGRSWTAEVEATKPLAQDEPPYVGSVVMGEHERLIVDDAIWSLDGPRRVAAVDGLARPRAIRGELLIGTGAVERDGARHAAMCRWRLADGQRISAIELPVRRTWSMSVDDSGRWVACNLYASRGLLLDLRDGVWLADLFAGTFTLVADAPGGAGISIAPDGESIAVTHDGTARVIDRTGAELRTIEVPAAARITTFSPDSRLLLVDGGDVDEDGLDEGDDRGLTILEPDGTRHRPAGDWWLGWDRDALVRKRGDVLERCSIDGAVLARCPIGDDVGTTWLGPGKVAFTRNDGRLIVRDLAWTAG